MDNRDTASTAVRNDDNTVTLTLNSDSFTEGDGVVTIEVEADLEASVQLQSIRGLILTLQPDHEGSNPAEQADFELLPDPYFESVIDIRRGQRTGTGTLRFRVVDDSEREGTEQLEVTAYKLPDTWGIEKPKVHLHDNDPALTVDPSTLQITEGERGSFQVQLVGAAPMEDVTVVLSAVSGSEHVSFSPNLIVIPTETWSQPRTVGVEALSDTDSEDEQAELEVRPSGSGFTETAKQTVLVTVNDDDHRVAIEPTSLSVREGSETGYRVVLATAPEEDVIVTIGGTLDTDATTTPSSMTFTQDTWDTPQEVTVVAAHDNDQQNESVTLTHTVTGWAPYAGLDPDDVNVTIVDDDFPEIVVGSTDLTVSEQESETYTVSLNRVPSATVTLRLDFPDKPDSVSVSPVTLMFGTDNWDVPQEVRVSSSHDDDPLDENFAVSHTASGGGFEVARPSIRRRRCGGRRDS